jgi:GMP synthase-like glutamine amidotransferase
VRILSIVHDAEARTGVFAEEIAARGHAFDEWLIPDVSTPPAPVDEYDAVLVLGGTMHVDQEHRHDWLRDELRLLRALLGDGVPVLGICLGGQLVAKALDAKVDRMADGPEIGWVDIAATEDADDDPVFSSLPGSFRALEWHSYAFGQPTGAVALARSGRCLQAFRAGDHAWAIQFHAEATHATLEGWVRASTPETDGPLDLERLRQENAERIRGWNGFGRELCGRWLAVAEGATEPGCGATTRATSPGS